MEEKDGVLGKLFQEQVFCSVWRSALGLTSLMSMDLWKLELERLTKLTEWKLDYKVDWMEIGLERLQNWSWEWKKTTNLTEWELDWKDYKNGNEQLMSILEMETLQIWLNGNLEMERLQKLILIEWKLD